MKRLVQAPNLVLATLWADMLSGVGIEARVQRAYNSSLIGAIPPDQSLPEVWVLDADRFEQAQVLLQQWCHLPERRWLCAACDELVEGPFEVCWNCGAAQPVSSFSR